MVCEMRICRGILNHGCRGSQLAGSSPDTEGLRKLPLDKATTRISFLYILKEFSICTGFELNNYRNTWLRETIGSGICLSVDFWMRMPRFYFMSRSGIIGSDDG